MQSINEFRYHSHKPMRFKQSAVILVLRFVTLASLLIEEKSVLSRQNQKSNETDQDR